MMMSTIILHILMIINLISSMLQRAKKFTNVQRISLMHFLHDRELDLRVSRTSKHVVRQRVCIYTEPPYDWPYSVRGKIQTDVRCKKEEEESDYKKDYQDYATRIMRKVQCFGKALCISIYTDIGKCVIGCVKVVKIGDDEHLRPNSQYKSQKDPRHVTIFRKKCDYDDMKVWRCFH